MVFAPQQDQGTADEAEKVRLTPMEIDVQLQAAELVFRSLLEGKRPGICHPKKVDDWYAEVCGADWVDKNAAQRTSVTRHMREDGEGTPMWVEAAGHVADLAWEMLEVRDADRELVRKLPKIDRTEVLEQLRELFPKVRDSHYARCGAADRAFGLRALVAVLRVFEKDAEVLEMAARCLTFMVTGNDYSRDGLAELFVAMGPGERRDANKSKGWSFLRAALNAFMVQAGAERFPSFPPAEEDDEADEEAPEVPRIDDVDREPRRDVAVRIAECIVATKGSPAMVGQLQLLQQETPEDAAAERRELKIMMEALRAKTEDLIRQDANPALTDLLQMLRAAREHPIIVIPTDA